VTVPILTYHRVGTEPTAEPMITRALTVPPPVFDA